MQQTKNTNPALFKSTDFAQKPEAATGSMFANLKQQMESLAVKDVESSAPSQASKQEVDESGSSSWETVGRPKRLND